MAVALDRKAYGKLLAKETPTLIHDEAQHAAALNRAKEIMRRENEASREEIEYLELLTALIEDYEKKRWPQKRENFSPHEVLQFLMEENGLKQSDLNDIAPQSNISAILAGKRSIGKATAIKLAERFHVHAGLFL